MILFWSAPFRMLLPDWLFYTLSVLFAALLIFFSIQYWPGQDQIINPFNNPPQEGVSISDRELTLMQAAQGLATELIEEDDVVFLRAAAGQGPDDGEQSAGVFLTLPQNFSLAYAKTMIELSMIIRGTGPNPSPKVMIGYYSPGRGNSPPTYCKLSTQWQACTLRYHPPPTNKKADVDYAGIWPDLEGLSRTVDIREIQVRPVPAVGSGLRKISYANALNNPAGAFQ